MNELEQRIETVAIAAAMIHNSLPAEMKDMTTLGCLRTLWAVADVAKIPCGHDAELQEAFRKHL